MISLQGNNPIICEESAHEPAQSDPALDVKEVNDFTDPRRMMPNSARTKLSASFKEYFEVVPALSDELKSEAYRIRHQVYCEELKFEQARPQGLEMDEYDHHSFHLLIRNVKTHEFIGCTRIIQPSLATPCDPLPFEKTCRHVLDRSIINPEQLPRQSIAEVSRLAVTSNYRRRKGEKNQAYCLSDEDFGLSMEQPAQSQPRFPYIPLSLYLGTTALAHLKKIETVFVLTEERLANHLNKLGFGLKFIGKPLDHRGTRIPSMISVMGVINGIKPLLRPLYDNIYDTIAADIKKQSNCSTIKW